MTHTSSVPHLGPEFEAFLFAPVGEDGHGMLLSVLSALARLNVDPWREAAKLAGLPVEKATERLTSLMAALPDGPSGHRDSKTIAARLVALLPRGGRPPAGSPMPVRATGRPAGLAMPSRTVLLIIFLVVVLGAQYVFAHRQSAAPIDAIRSPATSTASPPIEPPFAGR
jgi:hypothetical protein